MEHELHPPAILIGGTGGSGTRIFARALMTAGVYLGASINKSLDALSFVPLLTQHIEQLLDPRAQPPSETRLQRFESDLRACVSRHRGPMRDPAQPWGWKNPRSILLLPHFSRVFAQLKFVHVIRDGRDMALSSNQNQTRQHLHTLTGDLYAHLPLPLRSIAMWNLVNCPAARFGRSKMPGRYLQVRYEDLCQDPFRTVSRLLAFAEVPQSTASETCAEVAPPASLGRGKRVDAELLSRFHEIAGEGLELFGYLPSSQAAGKGPSRADCERAGDPDRAAD